MSKSLHDQLLASDRVGLDLFATIRVDKWRVVKGEGGSWVFLRRHEKKITRLTPKRIYCGDYDVFDRETGRQILRQELRIGRSYDSEIESVKDQHGHFVFDTAAGRRKS